MVQDEKPPSCQVGLDSSSGVLSANGTLVRQLKGIWQLWRSDWSFCPTRNLIRGRRCPISTRIQE